MGVTFLVAALALADTPDPFPWLVPGLAREITSWKEGRRPPRRLLQFPDGPPAGLPVCGMPVFEAEVGHYVSRIGNDELLKSLMFDPQANDACIRASARRLLELRGVTYMRTLLADKQKTDPTEFARAELATLTQLLVSPYVRVRAASIDKKDVPKDRAEKTLAALKADLAAKVPWNEAYGKAADSISDTERSRRDGGSRTFLCYRYDGLMSSVGFDLLNRQITQELDPNHIRKLFEVGWGIHRMDTRDRYWLYYVEAFYP
jgi:hypothetical protein